MILNIPPELGLEVSNGRVKFQIDDISTDWMKEDDSFVKRVDKSNLNPISLKKHLIKEIEVKNTLDEGIGFFKSGKYSKAIDCFDEVLFYDFDHAEALINKSFCFYAQKHFVKSLRHYKKAIKKDSSLRDDEYYRQLIENANEERSNFPKLKQNIYAGDEHFSKGEFQKALDSYNRALVNPSKFKKKILSKLLNKKGTALIKLNRFAEAIDCFKEVCDDYSYFAQGYCEYRLDLDVNEKFKSFLNIDKRRMLKQASILNELGLFNQSLAVCDYLMENHFKADEFYHELLCAEKYALDKLNKDSSSIYEIISKLYG